MRKKGSCIALRKGAFEFCPSFRARDLSADEFFGSRFCPLEEGKHLVRGEYLPAERAEELFRLGRQRVAGERKGFVAELAQEDGDGVRREGLQAEERDELLAVCGHGVVVRSRRFTVQRKRFFEQFAGPLLPLEGKVQHEFFAPLPFGFGKIPFFAARDKQERADAADGECEERGGKNGQP